MMVKDQGRRSVNIPISIQFEAFQNRQMQCVHSTCRGMAYLLMEKDRIKKYTYCEECGQVYYIEDHK